MNMEERIILWLTLNDAPCEERDLLNDALEELAALSRCDPTSDRHDQVVVRLEAEVEELKAEIAQRWTPLQKELALAALEKATSTSREEIIAGPLEVAMKHVEYVVGIKQRLAAAEAAIRDKDEQIKKLADCVLYERRQLNRIEGMTR